MRESPHAIGIRRRQAGRSSETARITQHPMPQTYGEEQISVIRISTTELRRSGATHTDEQTNQCDRQDGIQVEHSTRIARRVVMAAS